MTDRTTRVAASALLCAYQEQREGWLDEIRREKRRARIAGVVDLAKLYEWQGHAGALDEKITELRRDMRALRLAPLPCNHQVVRALSSCWDIEFVEDEVARGWSSAPECTSEKVAPYREALERGQLPSF